MEKFFDDDTLANDYVKNIVNHAAYRLFENQQDWLYMVGELGKGRWPMLKDNAVDYIEQKVEQEFHLLIAFITFELIKMYHGQDIDLSENVAAEYNEWFGYEPEDEGYIEGKPDPNGEKE